MTPRALLSGALLLAGAACTEPTAPPLQSDSDDLVQSAATVTSNTRSEQTLVVQKCGSPPVVVTGERHEVFRLHFDGDGGLHRGYHLNFRLSGESADGTRYSYSGAQGSQLYFVAPPYVDMTELRIRMIAQGDADDLIFVLRSHTTVTPSGETSSHFEVLSEECGEGASGQSS